jgi:O-antigen ligase/tetratricopeptide (TPR) repeat protein
MKDIIKVLVYTCLFAVPVLTLYRADTMFFPYITGKNFWFRMIVEAVVGLWFILCLYDKSYRPRFSWILVAFSTLIGVMALATLNAENVSIALWSNFERMDGYITLIHVYAYFVVLGSVLKTKNAWLYFFHWTLLVSALVAFIGLGQLAGTTNVRVDSTLGNAAYMAVYMLFHIFFLIYLFSQIKNTPYRIVNGVIIAIFTFVLLETGTRGTAIGLVVGFLATVTYIALFAKNYPQVRRYAAGSLAILVLLLGSFYAVRNTQYVQNSAALARVANISLGHDLSIRTIIWGMSIEGIKERPLLGWGNGNFNYVFNSQYDPRLYAQEQWFDRVHDIFFDWLIAGGVLGFLAYFSIFASLFYYLVVRPLRAGGNEFTLVERGILLGLIIGYILHNVVVFDNIVSYIFFAATLAFIHSRVATDMPKVQAFKMPEQIVAQVVAPIVAIVFAVIIYTVNVPNIQAAHILITALQTKDMGLQLDVFKHALELRTFAKQEIIEQLAQQAMNIANSQGGANVTPEVKAEYLKTAEAQLLALVAEKPHDARIGVFLASYYRSTGQNAKAETVLATARKDTPKKQSLIVQQGAVALALGKNTEAESFFKEAYELDTTNDEAREYYVAALIAVNKVAEAKKEMADAGPAFKDRIASSDFILGALSGIKEYGLMTELYEKRLAKDPTVVQNWASLAFMYYQIGKATSTAVADRVTYTSKAIDTLTRGAEANPSFKTTAECVISNIKADRAPDLGCTSSPAAN